MCGRIALDDDPDHVARLVHAGVSQEALDLWRPHWNVGPQSLILGVSERHGERTLDIYKWGLVPFWAKDPSTSKSTFNAPGRDGGHQADVPKGVRQPAHPGAGGCLLRVENSGSQGQTALRLYRADGEPVVFAGLREWWKGAEGHELRTATIITTEAGPDMPIHNRQPVVLESSRWDQWLDREVHDVERLQKLLVPTTAGTLIHHPVSKDVGNVRNNRADLMEAPLL